MRTRDLIDDALDPAPGPPPGPEPELRHLPPRGRAGLGAWLFLPPSAAPGTAPLVAVHGIGRDARGLAAALAPRAAALGRPLVAPIFEAARWPAYQRLVFRGRADLALIQLMSELALHGHWTGPRFALFGYSGGAQFAHRFALLHPGMVSRLTLVSAGWYTFPEGAPYPYGLGARAGRGPDDWGPRMAAGLDRVLRLPIDVCVGAADDAVDAATRSGPSIDAQQGPHRLARGRAWTAALNAAALAAGLPARARLHVLPGAGHDLAECLAQGRLDHLALPDAASPDRGPQR